MDRRQLLQAGLALPFVLASPVRAGDSDPVYIADMHAHFFFRDPGGAFSRGPGGAPAKPLGPLMAAGKATLVAWSTVGDMPWIRPTPRGLRQKGAPRGGEAVDWFQLEVARMKRHAAEQGLKLVAGPADIDRALAGEPHVVLSVEGATFLDEGLGQVKAAYDLGVRHIQLVHFIRNTIGDFQTEQPVHNGLSAFGKDVVRECNRQGILVDLAHCTEQVVRDALAVSTAPMVWSHSSLAPAGRMPHWSMVAWQARQLTLAGAKGIAAKGGVVGLWAMRSDTGPSFKDYADRLLAMAEQLGDDHAAFGTDMGGVTSPVIAGYADLRRVVEHWKERGVGDARIRKLAIGNYARVLRQALAARQT